MLEVPPAFIWGNVPHISGKGQNVRDARKDKVVDSVLLLGKMLGSYSIKEPLSTERPVMTKKDKDCWEPKKHPKHMCKLLKMGMMMEIDQGSAKPTVTCAKCGAKADVPASVCQPKPL
jgi:hypothetical protein